MSNPVPDITGLDLNHHNLLPEITEEEEEEHETIEDERWRELAEDLARGTELTGGHIDMETDDADDQGDTGHEDEVVTGNEQEEGRGDYEEAELEEMLDAVDADAGGLPTPQSTPPPLTKILDQPFMDGLHLLSDTLGANVIDFWTLLEEKDMDVDRWKIVLGPDEHLTRFKDTIAVVNLVNWIPRRRMDATYHRGSGFEKCLLLAQAIQQIWIYPRHKSRFFKCLDSY